MLIAPKNNPYISSDWDIFKTIPQEKYKKSSSPEGGLLPSEYTNFIAAQSIPQYEPAPSASPEDYMNEGEWDYLYPEDEYSPYYTSPSTSSGSTGPQFDPATQGIPASSPYWTKPKTSIYGTVKEEEKEPTYSIKQPTSSKGGYLGWGTPTTTTTSTTTPIMPTTPAPTFNLPEWDEEAIKEYRRKYMGTPMRSLQEGLRRTLSSLPSASNPYVAKEMGRGAVEQYGTGISQASTSAGMQALNEYLRRRAEEIAALQTKYQGDLTTWLAGKGRTTTTTSKKTYK